MGEPSFQFIDFFPYVLVFEKYYQSQFHELESCCKHGTIFFCLHKSGFWKRMATASTGDSKPKDHSTDNSQTDDSQVMNTGSDKAALLKLIILLIIIMNSNNVEVCFMVNFLVDCYNSSLTRWLELMIITVYQPEWYTWDGVQPNYRRGVIAMFRYAADGFLTMTLWWIRECYSISTLHTTVCFVLLWTHQARKGSGRIRTLDQSVTSWRFHSLITRALWAELVGEVKDDLTDLLLLWVRWANLVNLTELGWMISVQLIEIKARLWVRTPQLSETPPNWSKLWIILPARKAIMNWQFFFWLFCCFCYNFWLICFHYYCCDYNSLNIVYHIFHTYIPPVFIWM